MIRLTALSASLMAFGVSCAVAQSGGNYNVQTMNFDMWCQEQAHLAADHCDKRTPEDETIFEDYRDKIDRYEVPYLQQQQSNLAVHRDIMQSDPIDAPLSQNPDAQAQDPNRQTPMPLP
jgi:hypothetical protein